MEAFSMIDGRLTERARRLALLFPPVTVLGSVHTLYLANQQELGRTVGILYPFWGAALAAVVLASLLRRAAGSRAARGLLWVYYGAGWAVLTWCLLRGLEFEDMLSLWVLDTTPGTLLFVALWLASLAAVARRLSLSRIEPPLAAIAVVLALGELVKLAGLERPRVIPLRDVAAGVSAPTSSAPPNVYHLILDAYPDDFFEESVAPFRASFDGFVRYPSTRPLAMITRVSVPIFMTGRIAARDVRPYPMDALLGSDTLPSWLKDAGYTTVALLPRMVYGGYEKAFDHALFHDENSLIWNSAEMHRRIFNDLWFFHLAPASLVQPLARLRGLKGIEELRSVKGVQATAYNQPAESRLSFARFIEAEARLPARGRYTFIHLLVPHQPFLLSPDCSYRSALDRTDIQQQSACAVRLASDLLETLRRLGRYDDAAILIQGDHGSPVKPENGHATPDPSGWWRALLMVKAPRAHGPLRTSQERATLCDVAPTLLAAVGLKPTSPVDGRVLADALGATSASDRTLD